MASATSVPCRMISEDVKELTLSHDNAARPLKQALPCNVPLTEALLYSVPSSAQAVLSMSTNEALPHAHAVPKTEALLHNAFSSTELSCNSVSTQSTNLPPLARPMENLYATLPPPFLTKIYDMIEDVATNSTVSWSSSNNSFIVWNLSEFSQHLLPRYFKHNNFSSFVRQLNTYGFRKINSDCWEFAHEAFLRGQKHLLKDIHRRKPVGQAAQKNQPRQQLHEVVRLRQLQHAVECEAQAMAQRVQIAERRQEQIMNFLAKATQSPAFITQLMQQSEGLQLEHDGRKKRRLTSGTEEPEGVEGQQLLSEAGMSLREELPSFMALLSEHAMDGQSTKFSGVTSHAQLAIGDRSNTYFDFDSATATRLDGSLEDGSDDLYLDFDLQDFIEEIIPAENTPHGNATLPDVFWRNLDDKLQEKGEQSDSSIATAGDEHGVERMALGTDCLSPLFQAEADLSLDVKRTDSHESALQT